MSVLSLLEFAAKMAAAERAAEEAKGDIIAMACQTLHKDARSLIGHTHSFWPALKPETIAHKANGNTPLLETGELRDSYHWNADAREGYVGTDDPKGLWHEFGTSRGIPPRPVLAPTIERKRRTIENKAARILASAVAAGRAETGELFHLLREAGHLARETVETFTDDEE